MQINRGLLGWGLFLITLGAVPLAVRAGYLDEGLVRRAWELWPLVLIGIGLGLVLQRTRVAMVGGLVVAVTFGLMGGAVLAVGIGGGLSGCGFGVGGAEGAPFASQSGSLEAEARVRLELNCGDAEVTPVAGSGWTLSGTSDEGRVPEVRSVAGQLTIRTPELQGFGRIAGSHWELALPTEPLQQLDVSVNAGSAKLDLTGTRVPDIGVDVNAGDLRLDLSAAAEVSALRASANAGSLTVTLPAASMTGSIKANAGSIQVCAPSGAGLRFRTSDNPLSSHNFGGRGLVQDGRVWTTPGYDTATVRLDFATEANLGSITLNPEAGCD